MHILIIGAAGMIGAKLTRRLIADGGLAGKAIDRLSLVDWVGPTPPTGVPFKVETRDADLAAPGVAESLVAARPDVIFHLAAIVSGEAEADFDKGYRVNLDGTRQLFEAIRKVGDGYRPRVVFTSSIAVFGAPFPDAIGDEFFETPLTSYGTQKAIGELLLSDYTRRGFMDGIGIRLPTICVRPGKPNRAASGFFSGIIREPLAGQEAVLPVDEERAPLACQPALGRRLPDPCRGAGRRAAGDTAQSRHARRLGDGRRTDRGAAQGGRRCGRQTHPPRARPDDHARSSRAGRATSRRNGPSPSASVPRRASRRSSASTSRTNSAGPG